MHCRDSARALETLCRAEFQDSYRPPCWIERPRSWTRFYDEKGVSCPATISIAQNASEKPHAIRAPRGTCPA